MSTVNNEEEEESSDKSWRRLAMQFDDHRMQYKWHLEAMLHDPVKHRENALAFLQAGPKDGNQVLAERIMAERIKTLATEEVTIMGDVKRHGGNAPLTPTVNEKEQDDSKKLQLLGRFEYHHQKALLEATFDETTYTIKVWRDSYKQGTMSKDPQNTLTFPELGAARIAFQNVVVDLMHDTTLSDVSLYMQQHVKPSPQ